MREDCEAMTNSPPFTIDMMKTKKNDKYKISKYTTVRLKVLVIDLKIMHIVNCLLFLLSTM